MCKFQVFVAIARSYLGQIRSKSIFLTLSTTFRVQIEVAKSGHSERSGGYQMNFTSQLGVTTALLKMATPFLNWTVAFRLAMSMKKLYLLDKKSFLLYL